MKKYNSSWENLKKRPFKKNGKYIKCPICKTKTYFSKARLLRNARYCSKKCFNISKKGIIPSNLKLAQSKSPVGKKGDNSYHRKGKNHWNWQQENPSYRAIHAWIIKNYGKANKCKNPNCVYPRKNSRGDILLKPKAYQWANKTGNYKRDINNFIELCTSCHKKYDMGLIDIN